MMYPGIRLRGNGSVLTQASGANLYALIDCDANAAHGAVIEGCVLDGNRANNTDSFNVRLVLSGGANDVKIRDNIIRNGNGYGVTVNGGVNVEVVDNKFENFYAQAVTHICPTPKKVVSTRIARNRFGFLGLGAVLVQDLAYAEIHDNIIFGNFIGGPFAPLVVNTNGATVTRVSGPNFSTVRPGWFLICNNGGEYLVTAVLNNDTLTVASFFGGGLPPTLNNTPAMVGSGDCIGMTSCSTVSVANNSMAGGISYGIATFNGSPSQPVENTLIIGNKIYGSGKSGISIVWVDDGSGVLVSDTQIVGNLIMNSGQGGSAAGVLLDRCGIQVVGSGTRNTMIDGNTIKNDQSPSNTPYWLYLSGGTAGTVICGKNAAFGMINTGVSGDIISVVLSAAWGTTASVSNIVSTGDNVRFSITSGGTGQFSPAGITINKIIEVSDLPMPVFKHTSGTGTLQAYFGEQQSTRGAWKGFYNGLPVSGSIYEVQVKG